MTLFPPLGCGFLFSLQEDQKELNVTLHLAIWLENEMHPYILYY